MRWMAGQPIFHLPTTQHIFHLTIHIVSGKFTDDTDLLEFAGLGCINEFDLFGWECSWVQYVPEYDMPSDGQRVHLLKLLIDEGFGENVVISHDIHLKHQLVWQLPRQQGSWASYQIRKIAGCACAGNAVNVFTAFPVSDPDMHHGTCVTHVPWCMPGSLTSGFLWSQWRWKQSRHSRRMRNPQFYVSGKRPMGQTWGHVPCFSGIPIWPSSGALYFTLNTFLQPTVRFYMVPTNLVMHVFIV